MRFINLFLIEYLILASGIGVSLWEIGALRHLGPMWIGTAALVVAGMGILISVSPWKPAVSVEISPLGGPTVRR